MTVETREQRALVDAGEQRMTAGAGKILKGVGGLYSVATDSGQGVVLCSARGLFRKQGLTPLPGDDVEYLPDPARPGYGSLAKILPRATLLSRPTAANVEQIVVVLALSRPEPDFLLADKLILYALAHGVQPAVCINKTDLPPSQPGYEAEAEGYAAAGFPVARATNAGDGGYAQVRGLLAGRSSVLAGQSGVGKSTIFNGVLGGERMAVGEMSRKIQRGRNTTRHVELHRLPGGGYLVDSPGFSFFEAEDVGEYRRLDRFWPEFAPYAGQCRFKECSHLHEPGCAVLEALAQGKLHAGRHARYKELYEHYKALDAAKYR